MNRALGMVASLSLALVADGTHAASRLAGLTDDFIHFCGDTRGDADRAHQLADAEEWTVPPKGLTVPSFGDVTWVRRQGRSTQSHGVRRVLMVGTSAIRTARKNCAAKSVRSCHRASRRISPPRKPRFENGWRPAAQTPANVRRVRVSRVCRERRPHWGGSLAIEGHPCVASDRRRLYWR